MPNEPKFNSEYFVNSIVPQINSLAYPDGYKFGRKKCLLHFDNAPSHKSHFTLNALAKLPFNLIPNLEYIPDVSPFDIDPKYAANFTDRLFHAFEKTMIHQNVRGAFKRGGFTLIHLQIHLSFILTKKF